LDNARGVPGVYPPVITLQGVRPRLYWPITLVAAALVALLAYGLTSQGTDTSIDQSLQEGKRVEAPVKDLPELGGSGTSSLADQKGKVVVLNVWASWCPPCQSEMPLLQRTHEQIASEGGVVLGIDTQDSPDDAMAFLRKKKITFPSLRDRDREYGRDYGVSAYPETFLIDRKGRIAALRRGPVDQSWLDANLPGLLKEKA
jgi:cytochrome c biogenesis protein CcmG, thiol:disulfide interchange protein DsbE